MNCLQTLQTVFATNNASIQTVPLFVNANFYQRAFVAWQSHTYAIFAAIYIPSAHSETVLITQDSKMPGLRTCPRLKGAT